MSFNPEKNKQEEFQILFKTNTEQQMIWMYVCTPWTLKQRPNRNTREASCFDSLDVVTMIIEPN